MASKKSEKNNQKDVKENLPDVVSSSSPTSTDTDKVLDSIVGTQEQVTDEVSARIDDMSKQDTAGQVFNEEIHSIDKDGNPSMTGSGKFRLKKRRKEVATDEDLQRKSVAETSVGLFITLGVTLFGDEWIPDEKTKETEQLVIAFDNYYKAAGVCYLPPSLGLVVALGAYSLKRITQKNTQSKLGKVKDAIKVKLFNLFRRKRKQQTQPIQATQEIA